jgi:hypothetical protein
MEKMQGRLIPETVHMTSFTGLDSMNRIPLCLCASVVN